VGFFSLRSLSTTGGGGLGVGCFTTGFFGGGVAGLTTDACFVGAPSDKRSADASFSDPLGQREKANQPIAERPEKISKTASQAIRNDLPRPEAEWPGVAWRASAPASRTRPGGGGGRLTL